MEKGLMEVKVMGIVVDPKASNPVVVLADLSGQKALPIWIGVFEAEAISRGLEDVVTLRPMTHDLMKQILNTFQVTLTRVVIHDLKENTFYANLYLSIDGKELIVDSHPSDAIALAVRPTLFSTGWKTPLQTSVSWHWNFASNPCPPSYPRMN